MFCTELLTTSTPAEWNSAYVTCKCKTLQIEHFSNFCLQFRYCSLLQLTNSAVLLSASVLFASTFLWKGVLDNKNMCPRTQKLRLHYHCSLTFLLCTLSNCLFFSWGYFMGSQTPQYCYSFQPSLQPSVYPHIFSLRQKHFQFFRSADFGTNRILV